MTSSFSIKGNIVDSVNKEIFYGEVEVADKKIAAIKKLAEYNAQSQTSNYIIPGFIDSHVHIESSMLAPSEFAKLAVVHGTVATISDPHEIANVCGMPGVQYMIDNGKTVPFKFHFGAPSCVPATVFETAGAALDVNDVDTLLQSDDIFYLSEMMNFPGVLSNDADVLAKIAAAKKYNKPVDGHAPGLRAKAAKKYIDAGITTDHECFIKEEAQEKLQYGMKILIREGSAAKNFEALIDLMHEHYKNMMFCSDDKHPDSLVKGHINQLCARAVTHGIDVFKVLQAACINPVLHYNMKVGLLKTGDAADFIVIKDLKTFDVQQTYINGELVAENGKSLIKTAHARVINNFDCLPIVTADVRYRTSDFEETIPVIEVLDGQLITNKLFVKRELLQSQNAILTSSLAHDILKIVVVNRYKNAPVAKAFIKNFGIKRGALASSVAHDSHNIVAVGVDDESICKAVSLVIEQQGGISAVSSAKQMVLGLPVAGLMSNEDGYAIAEKYTAIDKMVKEELYSKLTSPFMTLSFMSLLVIPYLKLSDKGLFDGDAFEFV